MNIEEPSTSRGAIKRVPEKRKEKEKARENMKMYNIQLKLILPKSLSSFLDSLILIQINSSHTIMIK